MNFLHRTAMRAFHNEGSRLFLHVNTIVSIAIVISVVTVILQTVPEIVEARESLFYAFEAFFFFFFLAEYLLRVYSAPDKRKYIFSPLGILDFLCLLPGLMLLGPPFKDFGVLWVFRLLRILRLLRTIRLIRFVAPSERMRNRLARVFTHIQWINVEIYLFAFILVIVFSATFMFMVEGHLPDTHFPTIPDAMWWSLVTITTVGYGDLVPQTVWGKVIAGTTMMAGLALFALMLAVVGQITQKLLFGSEVRK